MHNRCSCSSQAGFYCQHRSQAVLLPSSTSQQAYTFKVVEKLSPIVPINSFQRQPYKGLQTSYSACFQNHGQVQVRKPIKPLLQEPKLCRLQAASSYALEFQRKKVQPEKPIVQPQEILLSKQKMQTLSTYKDMFPSLAPIKSIEKSNLESNLNKPLLLQRSSQIHSTYKDHFLFRSGTRPKPIRKADQVWVGQIGTTGKSTYEQVGFLTSILVASESVQSYILSLHESLKKYRVLLAVYEKPEIQETEHLFFQEVEFSERNTSNLSVIFVVVKNVLVSFD